MVVCNKIWDRLLIFKMKVSDKITKLKTNPNIDSYKCNLCEKTYYNQAEAIACCVSGSA